jgi:RNA-directed DNA polymerase
VLRLIGHYLRSGVQLPEGWREATVEGVPQGGPLSPLLANLLLDALDWELDRRGHRFVRYADDFVILLKSERAAHRVQSSIQGWLWQRLRLRVNAAKSQVCRTERAEFLSFTVQRKTIRASAAAVADFRHRVRQLTGRSWGVSMRYRIGQLNQSVRGWAGYFALGLKFRDTEAWDKWLRRRLRMCWWKRWRRVRRRVAELLKLGCDKHRAITAAMSRKSFWRLSRTYATQLGMTNEWLKNQGVVSLSELWIAVHHPVSARPEPPRAVQVNLWGW